MQRVVVGLLAGVILLLQTGCFKIAGDESAGERGCAWCGAASGPLWAWLEPDYGWDEYDDGWIEEVWVEDWYWSEDESSYFDAYYDQWYYSGYYDGWYCEQCDAWHYDDWYDESYYDEGDD